MEAAAPTRTPANGPGGLRTAAALSVVAVATIAFGLIADAAGLGLGTPLPPLFATWDPAPISSTLLWLLPLAAAAALALPLARGFGGPWAFVAGATVVGLVARLSVAAARGGTSAWYSVFGLDPEAANEYLPALPALDLGLGTFLDRYAELAPSLPIHPSAHPPGTLILLDWLGIDGAGGMAALVIAAGLAAVPLTYLLARRLAYEEAGARTAALLLALSPSAMLFGVASADAMFMTIGLLSGLLLLTGGLASRAAGGVVLALASFFSWALLAIGALAAAAVAQREGLRRALLLAAGAGAALVGFYLALWAASGYDALGVLAAANEAYELGIANARPWAYWLFGSPVAFFVAVGLPISWYAARALGTGDAVAVAVAVVVVIAALLGFSKAETERIWLFLAPFVCLAAAAVLPRRRLPLVIALLAAQAAVYELTLETVW